MNHQARTISASVLLALLSQSAMAQAPTNAPDTPRPALSPGTRSLINLGQAGLLQPFFSDEQFGFAQSRMGASRYAYGEGGANPQLTDFREDGNTLIAPINIMMELPAKVGASYLRFTGTYTQSESVPHALDLETTLYHGAVAFLHLPDPDTMWGVGLVANDFKSEDTISGTEVIRDSLGLRLDYLKKFSDNWGIATRGLYLWGDTENRVYNVPTGHGPANLRQKQDDDRYYLQADLVGSYLGDTTHWLPDGSLAHPRIGALYHHSDLGTTTPRLGTIELPEVTGVDGPNEDFGLTWAHFQLQKAPRHTTQLQWIPSAMVGVEYEYENSLNRFNDEDTYAVFGAELTATIRGHGFFINYKRYQGLEEERVGNVFVTGVNVSF
ncbi:hypothetical protein ACT3UM_18195 [Halomonas sp. AOP13-D3-9]